MKINFDKNLVSLIPESAEEISGVDRLWRLLIDCVNETRKLTPVGEFVPAKNSTATFYIEGLETKSKRSAPVQVMHHSGRVCCFVCNKFVDLKTGDSIPLCCGKPMEVMD
jgi:hypothetical protein